MSSAGRIALVILNTFVGLLVFLVGVFFYAVVGPFRRGEGQKLWRCFRAGVRFVAIVRVIDLSAWGGQAFTTVELIQMVLTGTASAWIAQNWMQR